ncbi:unnamed protein product [Alternaria sp. RS040]
MQPSQDDIKVMTPDGERNVVMVNGKEVVVSSATEKPNRSFWVAWMYIFDSRLSSVPQIYGLRFLLGVLETPASTGSIYLLTSWYRADEVFKRAGVWYVSSNAGAMFSGYLQAAAHKNLDGIHGMSGWRWLFIIDGSISLPIGLAGFLLYPGLPTSPKVWWLTEDERKLAVARMQSQGTKQSGKIGKRMLKRVFTHWHFYVAVLTYVFFQCTSYVGGQMQAWLKKEADLNGTYTIEEINLIPTGVQGLAIVCGILMTITCYYLLGLTSCVTPILFPWVNMIMKDDNEARSFTTGAMMTIGWAFFSFYPITVFPILEAPQWAKGYTVNIVFIICYWILFMVGQYLWRREEKTKKFDINRQEDEDVLNKPEAVHIEVADDKTMKEGAGFSETAAQLEGFARPLWAVAMLFQLKQQGNQSTSDPLEGALEPWVTGIRAGTDPQSPEYWGDLSDFDQRMVEMESIAFALLANPTVFSFDSEPTTQANLIAWLRQINEHKMPETNWLWFRVLVNIALLKTLNVPLLEVQAHIDKSLEKLDTFDIGEGWSSDGLWCEQRKQADYYSGSFAIQFAQLLYIRFAPEYDSARTFKYIEQAREFGKEYWRYFDPQGAAIPFGRSLTYRFAFAAFWAAVVFAGVELPAPIEEMGLVKGLLLRHLRWWAKQPHIFNTDGTPNIGFAYPNMYLAEDYNSPQSVYWCLKSFLVLGLNDTDAFWQAEELGHPRIREEITRLDNEVGDIKVLWPPRQILCNTQEHTFLLSSEQSTTKRFKAREAKYGKLAYSSAFGFSVPCGPSLEQVAPDSTLLVSMGLEEDDWKVRWSPYDVETGKVYMKECGETVPIMMSRWKPWIRLDVVIETLLMPPMRRWPGWSVRVHHVKCTTHLSMRERLQIVEGGFAASAQAADSVSIFEEPCAPLPTSAEHIEKTFGWWSNRDSAFILSESGASGIVNLTDPSLRDTSANVLVSSRATVIRADPNT